MNSLRAVFRALEYEIRRQAQLWDQGDRVAQETRGWVEERGVTVSQRSKEFAHDYRYFPEPDLPPLHISRDWVEELRSQLPELPDARRDRYMAQYGLSRYDASLLTASKPMADLFEACLTTRFPDIGRLPAHPEPVEGRADKGFQKRAKAVANWLNGDMLRLLNQSGTEIEESQVSPEGLAELVELVEEGAISSTQAKSLFQELFAAGASPRRMVEEQGLAQVSGADELLPAVEAALDGNPQAVQDYLKGKETAIRFLMGQVMKATRGKANPTVVTSLLTEQLETRREK
jgi:aspartyl-tRNA(Asn)/glutamyl-tRNA(Gln) amidotransferase subunit B